MHDMKTIGIIAEFNPLHNGHAYLLRAAREHFGADHILLVMSGDHVQRGEPAILNKYLRCEMALRAGADLVLELPVTYATGSAQYFARGAVSALLHSGVCDGLLFGSESGDMQRIREIASRCPQKSDGSSHKGHFTPPDERSLPNDLLAAEYLKALAFFRAKLPCQCLPRILALTDETSALPAHLSAAELRQKMFAGEDIRPRLPAFCNSLLSSYQRNARLMRMDAYSSQLYYSLLTEKTDGYSSYFDVFDDLSDKIISHLEQYESAEQFAQLLKSKDLALSHIRRALLHILLRLRDDEQKALSEETAYCPYLRILGLRTTSPLTRALKGNADRPLISRAADSRRLETKAALACIERENFASTLYAACAKKSGGSPSDYRHKIICL